MAGRLVNISFLVTMQLCTWMGLTLFATALGLRQQLASTTQLNVLAVLSLRHRYGNDYVLFTWPSLGLVPAQMMLGQLLSVAKLAILLYHSKHIIMRCPNTTTLSMSLSQHLHNTLLCSQPLTIPFTSSLCHDNVLFSPSLWHIAWCSQSPPS